MQNDFLPSVEIHYRKGEFTDALNLLLENQEKSNESKEDAIACHLWLMKILNRLSNPSEHVPIETYLTYWQSCTSHENKISSLDQDLVLNHLLILMNAYGDYERAKSDALAYLYPSEENNTDKEPHPDCQVHELLVNFILPKLEGALVFKHNSVISVSTESVQSIASEYSEKAAASALYYYTIVKRYFMDKLGTIQTSSQELRAWMSRVRTSHILAYSEHPAFTALVFMAVSYYLLRERAQRSRILESGKMIFRALTAPY